MSIKLNTLISVIVLTTLSGCKAYYNAFYTDPAKCLKIAEQKKPYDVIIVPGFPHDSGKVNMVQSQRIKWAYYLYKNGYAKNIIFSGAAVHTPYVEAKVMKLIILQTGIDSNHVFTETKAQHTTENLYYSYLLAQDLKFKSIAFATEPAQSSFMKPFNRKFKLQLDFIPVVSDSVLKMDLMLHQIDESSTFVPNFIPLKEKEGLIKSLRGTRGHQVKKEIRKAKKLKRQKQRYNK
jgi:uncharacterized SAM-binding protein YcdF (DUF218 family)